MDDRTPADKLAEYRASAEIDPPPPRNILKKVARAVVFLGVLAAVGVWATNWIMTSMRYVQETDARVKADLVAVASRVGGWVVDLPATEGLQLTRGDILVQVDAREAGIRLAELEAELRGLQAQRERMRAEIEVVDARTESLILSEQSNVAAFTALLEAVETEVTYARDEAERARNLNDRGVLSNADLDRARTTYLGSQQQVLRTRAELAEAEADLAQARAERGELLVMERALDELTQREAVIAARVEQQSLDLRDRSILSPLDGVVTRVFVDPGEFVQPGQRIALIHNPEEVWVEANIRETEVRRLELGQRVEIAVDAYPDQPMIGRVSRIGYATTSQFALLPSPNPSGNFTKITQRIPVKIDIEGDTSLLKPGMMVEVAIDVAGE